MQYISVERFYKEASVEVRHEILKWWNYEVGDLVESKNKGCVEVIKSEAQTISLMLSCKGKEVGVTPLLTTGQLIEYIKYSKKISDKEVLEKVMSMMDKNSSLLDVLWGYICKDKKN